MKTRIYAAPAVKGLMHLEKFELLTTMTKNRWCARPFNPLTAGVAYIRVFIFY